MTAGAIGGRAAAESAGIEREATPPPGSLAVLTAAPANGLYVIRAHGTGLTPLLVSDNWKREPDWVATG
jgi:hypothetical protein